MKTAPRDTAASSALQTEWMLTGPDFFKKVVIDRRATPHFTGEAIPETVLRSILSLAQQAPSGYNFQPWRFVVVRNRENLEQLRRAAFNQQKVTEAGAVIVAFGQREGWKETIDEVFRMKVANGVLAAEDVEAKKKGALEFLAKTPPAIWLNRHVIIAFTYLMLAAESLGWNTAPMEGFDPQAVSDVLALPPDAEVIALLAIGRAANPPAKYPGRLPIQQWVYSEKFGQTWSTEPT
jgi:nitroreductase